MKKIILFQILFLETFLAPAQKFEWLTWTEGASINNVNQGNLAADAANNLYVAGSISGTTMIGADTIVPYGSQDILFVKMDAAGNIHWTTHLGNGNFCEVTSIAVDKNANVYLACYSNFNGVLMTPDTNISIPGSNYNIFSFDSAGAFRWVKTGLNGNAHLAATNTAVGFFAAWSDSLAKIDDQGNVQWSKKPVAPFTPTFTALSVNNNGMVVFLFNTCCGAYNSSINFDTLSIPANVAWIGQFVVVCDTSGNGMWGKEFSSNATFISNAVAISDASNEVYVGVEGSSILYFANDSLVNPVSPGHCWGGVLKFDATGNPRWARAYYAGSGGTNAHVTDMTINATDEVVFCGHFSNSAYCYFGPFSLPWDGVNAIVAKLDSAGNYIWAKMDPRVCVAGYSEEALHMIRFGANNYVVGGYYISSWFPFYAGCNAFTPGTYNTGHYITFISENTEPVPVADFSVLKDGNTVLLKNTSQNSAAVHWDFGDASTSTANEPIHTFSQPGSWNVCLTASNGCGSATVCKNVDINGIREMDIDHGSQDGIVTADIWGGGFTPAATVLLKKAGNPDMVPYFTHYINSGKLQVRLDLTAQSLGSWDVEVTIPGDTVMTLQNGFTVDSAAEFKFDITYDGPTQARGGSWVPSGITVHNNSAKDAAGVVVVYRTDETWIQFVYNSMADVQQIPFLNSGLQYLSSNGLNTANEDFRFADTAMNSTYGAFLIPLLKANSSYRLQLFAKGTVIVTSPKITTMAGPLLAQSTLTGTPAATPGSCFGDFLKQAVEQTLAITIADAEWNSCYPALYDSLIALTAQRANDDVAFATPVSMPAVLIAILASMSSSGCITGIPASLTDAQLELLMRKSLSNIADSTGAAERISSCPTLGQFRKVDPLPSPQYSGPGVGAAVAGCAALGFPAALGALVLFPPMAAAVAGGLVAAEILCFAYVASVDPNSITGPGNNNDDIWQKPGDISSYTVSFENADTATAPAQVVIVTDTLDISKYDLRTFRFTSVTIGDSLKFEFDGPGFSRVNFSSLAPFNSDYLRTEAVLDTATGIIRYTLTTVDPVSFDPDTNVFAGFLPPNVNGTEGTGHLSWFVQLKPSLVTGDSIRSRATIVFDNNAPVATNTWLNAIDLDKPFSSVGALPASTTTASFVVSWSGSDVISGIRSYAVYVSENDQPYVLWIPATDSTQTTFTGLNGSKYEFLSIATDQAGNVEDPPADPANSPDAVTTVTVGIDELTGGLAVSVWPNPVTDFLKAETRQNLSEACVEIYSSVGQQMMHTFYFSGDRFELDCRLLPAGIYFLKIQAGESNWKSWFVKE